MKAKARSKVILPEVVAAALLQGFCVRLHFSDGKSGDLDMAHHFVGRPGILGELSDPARFAKFEVDAEAGTLTWPNGVDLDPIVLYCEATRTPIRKIIPWAEETETTQHFT